MKYPYNCELGKAKRQKFYVVALGKHQGIFLTWLEVRWLVNEFSGAKHKPFKSVGLARHYLQTELAMLPPLPPPTHRVYCEKQDELDLHGHEVYECSCCLEISYTNGKDVALY